MTPDQLETLLRMPERPRAPPKILARELEDHGAWTLERLVFDIGGEPVRGLLTRPAAYAGRRPAVLYYHAHGARHEIGAAELVDGRPSLLGPYGPLLAGEGHVSLSIDMPTFGERAGQQ